MSDSLAYFKTMNKNLIRRVTRVDYKFTNDVSATFFNLDKKAAVVVHRDN
jgi:hypothetical protein